MAYEEELGFDPDEDNLSVEQIQRARAFRGAAPLPGLDISQRGQLSAAGVPLTGSLTPNPTPIPTVGTFTPAPTSDRPTTQPAGTTTPVAPAPTPIIRAPLPGTSDVGDAPPLTPPAPTLATPAPPPPAPSGVLPARLAPPVDDAPPVPEETAVVAPAPTLPPPVPKSVPVNNPIPSVSGEGAKIQPTTPTTPTTPPPPAPPSPPPMPKQWSYNDPRTQAQILAEDYGGDYNAFIAASPNAAIANLATLPGGPSGVINGKEIQYGSDGSVSDATTGAPISGPDATIAKTIAAPFDPKNQHEFTPGVGGVAGVGGNGQPIPGSVESYLQDGVLNVVGPNDSETRPITNPTGPRVPVDGPSDTRIPVPTRGAIDGDTPRPDTGVVTRPTVPSLPVIPTVGTPSVPQLAAMTPIDPENDLRSQQINPSSSADLTALTNLVSNAANAVGNGKTREQIANDTLDAFDLRAQPIIRDRQRSAAQRAASFGRIGMGDEGIEQLRPYTDYLTERAALSKDLAAETASGDITDRLNKLSALSGVQGQRYGQESANRNELRTERGYQTETAQQAIRDAIQQFLLEQQAQDQEFRQGATLAGLGYGNSPSSLYFGAGQQYGSNAGMDFSAIAALLAPYLQGRS